MGLVKGREGSNSTEEQIETIEISGAQVTIDLLPHGHSNEQNRQLIGTASKCNSDVIMGPSENTTVEIVDSWWENKLVPSV